MRYAVVGMMGLVMWIGAGCANRTQEVQLPPGTMERVTSAATQAEAAARQADAAAKAATNAAQRAEAAADKAAHAFHGSLFK